MQKPTTARQHGFTLVELLVVIAIIALLIGILVPSVSKVQEQAKITASKTLLGTLGKGCEMFQGEMDNYPRSAGNNPFESVDGLYLSGAQWLVLQLAGADLKGFVKKNGDEYYDSSNGGSPGQDGYIDEHDWRDWYDLEPSQEFRRFGPYIPTDGEVFKTPQQLEDQLGAVLTDRLGNEGGLAGTSDFSNYRLPLATDRFGYPVLYYRANARAKHPFTEGFMGGATTRGVYSQTDNMQFTGTDQGGQSSDDIGIDLNTGRTDHPLGELGWDASNPTERPEPDGSFAEVVYDAGIFDQRADENDRGRVWPRRADTFILIAPGPDAIYGTDDDITNF